VALAMRDRFPSMIALMVVVARDRFVRVRCASSAQAGRLAPRRQRCGAAATADPAAAQITQSIV